MLAFIDLSFVIQRQVFIKETTLPLEIEWF